MRAFGSAPLLWLHDLREKNNTSFVDRHCDKLATFARFLRVRCVRVFLDVVSRIFYFFNVLFFKQVNKLKLHLFHRLYTVI